MTMEDQKVFLRGVLSVLVEELEKVGVAKSGNLVQGLVAGLRVLGESGGLSELADMYEPEDDEADDERITEEQFNEFIDWSFSLVEPDEDDPEFIQEMYDTWVEGDNGDDEEPGETTYDDNESDTSDTDRVCSRARCCGGTCGDDTDEDDPEGVN